MSCLSVYHVSTPDIPNKVLTHLEDIVATLAEQGIRFGRRQATVAIQAGASQEEVITAYQALLEPLKAEEGYQVMDVISASDDHPQRAERRLKWLEEQSHRVDEARWFVAGRGLLSVHRGEYVYAVLCERDDLIFLPAGTTHWFDMGEFARCVAIRLFAGGEAGGEAAGKEERREWQGQLSGDPIAKRFPLLED